MNMHAIAFNGDSIQAGTFGQTQPEQRFDLLTPTVRLPYVGKAVF